MPKSIAMCEDGILSLPYQKPYVVRATADYGQELRFRGNIAVDALKMFHTNTVRESLQPEGYCCQLAEKGKIQTFGSSGGATLVFGSKDVVCYTALLKELVKMGFLFCLLNSFSKYFGENPPLIRKGTISRPRKEDWHA